MSRGKQNSLTIEVASRRGESGQGGRVPLSVFFIIIKGMYLHVTDVFLSGCVLCSKLSVITRALS